MATGIHILVEAETRMSAVGVSLRILWLAAAFGLGSCLPGGFLLSASAGQPPVQEQALAHRRLPRSPSLCPRLPSVRER